MISTDRDGVFEGALGVHDIPLDYRIRWLELTKLGVVGLAEQVFRDNGQGLLRSEWIIGLFAREWQSFLDLRAVISMQPP